MCWVSKHLVADIARAVVMMTKTLQKGGKLLFCGNGGSAADAQHLAAELVGRFSQNRDPIPAMALTTDTSVLTALANDYGFESIFARQVQALAHPGDVLVLISTSGTSGNLVAACQAANERGVHTIALLGRDGGQLAKEVEVALVVASQQTARIQECHIAIGHVMCHLVEKELSSDA
jgi:D-sedoheptulose 7-phosphate isomerase